MDSKQKELLPSALGLVGGIAGSFYGYKEGGAFWTWPRFVYSLMGSGMGTAVGLTANALIPTTPATGVGYLGAASAVSTKMLLPGIEPNDAPTTPLKLRRIEIVRGDAPIPPSDTLKILAMSTNQRAKRSNKDIPNIIRQIDRKYSKFIKEAALLHNVPFEILMTKISIENPDLLATVVTGGGATGIMQITPGTASTVLVDEYRKKNLTEVEAAWFRKKLGARFDGILSGARKLTTADLQQVELNIHLGALAIGQYIRKYTDPASGIVYLHKAVAEYNRGQRAETANKVTKTPDQLIAYKNGKLSTPPVTQQYIMSYCGPGGALDLLTRHKLTASATPNAAGSNG
jgi:hypothetical protein